MEIYGAGMSGLLAAHMLRRFNPVVHEAAAELPNNHAALLRFRSDAVSKETGIKFKKVWVQKAVMGLDGILTTSPTIQEQNLYSLKVSGTVAGRSIGNLAAGERYIAPEDFISRLAEGINIKYESPLKDVVGKNVAISTIPMNMLMKIAGWSDMPEFKYSEITTITADITVPCDVYQTIYHPDPSGDLYRTSITGNKLIIESVGKIELTQEECEHIAASCLVHFFGSYKYRNKLDNIKVKQQKYGKLINSTGRAGKQFILAMTDLHNIYSLGRFSTWRQILMDDVVNDIKVIEKIIEDKDGYSRKLNLVR